MTSVQNSLIEDNINFAYWKASNWAMSQDAIDYDELSSIALLALTKAANTYDAAKGTKFLSYANFIIDNDIKTELKKVNRHNAMQQSTLDNDEELPVSHVHDNLEDNLDIETAISKLPTLNQQMLFDFYDKGLTQYEIADKYHVSQTKVSIILKKSKELIAQHLNP